MLLLQVHFIRNWKMRTVEDVKPVRYGYIHAGWRTGIFTVMIPSCIRVDIKFLSWLVYLLFITFYYAFYLISIDIKYTCRGFIHAFCHAKLLPHYFLPIKTERIDLSIYIFIPLNLCYFLFKRKICIFYNLKFFFQIWSYFLAKFLNRPVLNLNSYRLYNLSRKLITMHFMF